jgi:hypothetical protein
MTTNAEGLESLAYVTQEADEANPDAGQRQDAKADQVDSDQAEQSARDWAMLMFMVGGFATMIAPELKPIYAEDRCLTWGRHANQVATKYGWNSPSGMPEIALLGSTITIMAPTIYLVRAKLRDAKAEGMVAKVGAWWRNRQARKAAPGAAPAAETAQAAG